jgi:hypothetical protein
MTEWLRFPSSIRSPSASTVPIGAGRRRYEPGVQPVVGNLLRDRQTGRLTRSSYRLSKEPAERPQQYRSPRRIHNNNLQLDGSDRHFLARTEISCLPQTLAHNRTRLAGSYYIRLGLRSGKAAHPRLGAKYALRLNFRRQRNDRGSRPCSPAYPPSRRRAPCTASRGRCSASIGPVRAVGAPEPSEAAR